MDYSKEKGSTQTSQRLSKNKSFHDKSSTFWPKRKQANHFLKITPFRTKAVTFKPKEESIWRFLFFVSTWTTSKAIQ
jgi:hypothetical protein